MSGHPISRALGIADEEQDTMIMRFQSRFRPIRHAEVFRDG